MEDKSGWERGAGANDRSAKRGNRTVLDCVEPKVGVKEKAETSTRKVDVKKTGQTVSKIVGADVFVSPSTCLASVQLGLDSTLMRTPSRSSVELEKGRLEISREKLTLLGCSQSMALAPKL